MNTYFVSTTTTKNQESGEHIILRWENNIQAEWKQRRLYYFKTSAYEKKFLPLTKSLDADHTEQYRDFMLDYEFQSFWRMKADKLSRTDLIA